MKKAVIFTGNGFLLWSAGIPARSERLAFEKCLGCRCLARKMLRSQVCTLFALFHKAS